MSPQNLCIDLQQPVLSRGTPCTNKIYTIECSVRGAVWIAGLTSDLRAVTTAAEFWAKEAREFSIRVREVPVASLPVAVLLHQERGEAQYFPMFEGQRIFVAKSSRAPRVGSERGREKTETWILSFTVEFLASELFEIPTGAECVQLDGETCEQFKFWFDAWEKHPMRHGRPPTL